MVINFSSKALIAKILLIGSFLGFFIPWVKISLVAGASLSFYHLAALIPLIYPKEYLWSIRLVNKKFPIFYLLIISYIALSLIHIFLVTGSYQDIAVTFKNIVYFHIFLGLITFSLIFGYKSFEYINYGLVLSAILFLSVNLYVNTYVDPDLLSQLFNFIISGDSNGIHHVYFKKLLYMDRMSSSSMAELVSLRARNFFGLAAVLLFYLNSGGKSRIKRFLQVVAFILILLSQSRSAFVSFSLIYVLNLAVRQRGKLIILFLFLGVAVLFGALIKNQSLGFGRLTELADQGRMSIYGSTLELINKNSIVGYGLNSSFDVGHKTYESAHNMILDNWLKLGLVGLIITSGFLLFFLRTLIRGVLSFKITNYNEYWVYSLFLIPVIIRFLVGAGEVLFNFYDYINIYLAFMATLQPTEQLSVK